jgi:hypothetical protein
MYIRRIKGPHSVTLPGGSVMTRADLPDPQTRRWVASRKAAVVRAVDHGLITEAEARETWDLSERNWPNGAGGRRHGVARSGRRRSNATAIPGRWRIGKVLSYFADRWIQNPSH